MRSEETGEDNRGVGIITRSDTATAALWQEQLLSVPTTGLQHGCKDVS